MLSLSNNKLTRFPEVEMFVANDQSLLTTLTLNDNLIESVPSQISQLCSLKSLMLHSNPIGQIPVSLRTNLDILTEISLDWFKYLQPFIGKIIRVKTYDGDQSAALTSQS